MFTQPSQTKRVNGIKPRHGLMMKPIAHSSTLTPILAAEAASTAISLGALALMQHHAGALKPLKQYLARTTIYPTLARHNPHEDQAQLMHKAEDEASLSIKAVGMVGAGFLSHLPIQMGMEGKLSGEGLRHAAIGKGVGLGAALGSIVVVNKVAPNMLPALQNALFPIVKPFLPKDEKGRDSRQAEEVAKLLILDIPSSIAAGLINYQWAKTR